MSDTPKINKFTDQEYKAAHIPIGNGTTRVEGITVRALQNALLDADPDDVVVFMAENTPQAREADIILGGIAMVGAKGNCGATFLCGLEGARALVRRYLQDK